MALHRRWLLKHLKVTNFNPFGNLIRTIDSPLKWPYELYFVYNVSQSVYIPRIPG